MTDEARRRFAANRRPIIEDEAYAELAFGGGRVTLDSASGRGSTFHVFWPKS